MTEKEIESEILTWLNYQQGVFAFKINTVGIYDPDRKVFRKNKNPFIHKGTSDIVGLYRGRFFAIEVKHPKYLSRVTEDQVRFQAFVKDRGGYAIVATSLNDAIHLFERMKQI